MGSSESKTVVNTIVQAAPEAISPDKLQECEAQVKKVVDEQFEEIKAEVNGIAPTITENVEATVDKIEGCDIMEYENLGDILKITEDLEKTFGKVKGAKVIIEMATGALEAMKDRKELKRMSRWQQRQRMQVVPGKNGAPDKVVGLELHYKVVIVDETLTESIIKKYFGSIKKKTIVLVAYKVLSHTMFHDPVGFLTKQQLDSIDF